MSAQEMNLAENAIIDAFESYVHQHPKLKTGRLAIGSRVLTWSDVIREMRARTPFGQQLFQSLADRKMRLEKRR
jgi:hypothetical protein